jgi:hypothetical protein
MPYNFSIAVKERIDSNSLSMMLDGRVPLLVFKEVLPESFCASIANRFLEYGYEERADGVPGLHVGSFHYGKSMGDYIEKSRGAEQIFKTQFGASYAQLLEIHDIFEKELSLVGVKYRVAKYENSSAGQIVLRSWSGDGEYAVLPHEDMAQLMDPLQSGFEIQKVAYTGNRAISVNMCFASDSKSGQVQVWDLKPKQFHRRKFNVESTGYPYPASLIENVECVEYAPKVGDIYCINGEYLHAVKRSSGFRLAGAFCFGRVSPSEVLYWT